jgi:hypothetical protein
MGNNVTFKRVKSIVFGKQDEDFFYELNKSGYFDKNWNNKIKELIKSDFYGSKENLMTFTKEQENSIVDIIKKYIKDINSSSNHKVFNEVVCDKENIDKSKEALQALSNLQRFRKK